MAHFYASRPRILTWYNDSSETCPAFGLIQCREMLEHEGSGDDLLVQGDKPGDGATCQFVNLGNPVAAGEYGQCTRDFPAYAAFDTDDGLPENGESWGPQADSWKLRKNVPGFIVLGNPVNGVVAVAAHRSEVIRKAEMIDTLQQGDAESARAWLLTFEGDEWQRTSEQIDLYGNEGFRGVAFGRTDEVDSGDKIDVYYSEEAGRWYGVIGGWYFHGTIVEDIAEGAAGEVLLNVGAGSDEREITVSAFSPYGPVSADDLVSVNWNTFSVHWDIARIDPGVDPGCGLELDEDEESPDYGKLKVKVSELAGPGLDVTEDACPKLEVATGCGIEIVENAVSVKNSDLTGTGITTEGSCGLAVDLTAGCGIAIDGAEISVDHAALAGTGLVTSGECGLAVSLVGGCGITAVGNVVAVDRADLIGDGLQPGSGTCGIEVKPNCHILVGEDGVAVDTSTLPGDGLEEKSDDPCNKIGVKAGCHISVDSDGVAVDVDSLAGAGLEEGTDEPCPKLKAKVGCGLHLTASGIEVTLDQIAGAGLAVDTSGECDVLTVESSSLPYFDDCTWFAYCNSVWVEKLAGVNSTAAAPTGAGRWSGETVLICNCTSVLCPGTLVSEDFTASDSTALNGMVPDVGPSACVAEASYDILSNRARQTGGSGYVLAYWESGEANVTVAATLRCTTFGSVSPHAFGLIGRYVDANNYWLLAADSGTGNLLIQEVTGGTVTTRAATSMGTPGTATIALNTDYSATLVFSGNSISGTWGAYSVGPYSSASHNTATKHGLLSYAGYLGTYNYDNLSITC